MNRILWAACLIVIAPAGLASAEERVYLAQAPGECTLPSGFAPTEYTIYVHSGDYSDISGVSFRLECDRFGPADVSALTTPPGVTIVGGSLFDGIVLAFSPRALAHDAVLTIGVASQELFGSAYTRDVALLRGSNVHLVPDFETYGWFFDCYGTFVLWDAPDTVSVTVNKDDTFQFRAVVTMSGHPPNATVSVIDPAGWVLTPFSEDVHADCGWCPWDITTVTVPTHVPDGATDGALNEITLRMSSFGGLVGERTLWLRAVQPVPVARKTIGAVKALYR